MSPSSSRESARSLLPTTTDSVEETVALAADLASILESGTVLALYGELGTGKTHFVKGIGKGLGLSPSRVRSPTFTILHTYEDGRHPLHHFDAYRVQTPGEFVEIGFEEYLDGPGISCIEWADRVESLLPPGTLHITLRHVGAEQRRIALRPAGTEDHSEPAP